MTDHITLQKEYVHRTRKADHIRISLEMDVESHVKTGFDRFRFVHHALPEIALADVDTSTQFLGKSMSGPLIISAMTGGTKDAMSINRNLAEAVQKIGIGMGLGSQRAAIEDPSLSYSYIVRDIAPTIPLYANLGAVQLNYGYTVDHCRQAIDMIEADALVLHLNPLQEALQPEGNTDYRGLLSKIESVCRALSVPVIVKEIGCGISADTARRLANAGVAALDVAGVGGTSWSQIELYRIKSAARRQVAIAFRDWGIPTADALAQVRNAVPGLPLIASGGIRDGICAAKAIALGATACGIARPFLLAAIQSSQAAAEAITSILEQLRIAMFAAGVPDIAALAQTPLGPVQTER